jgi:DNA-nicking Smr family endonuclease
MSKQSKSNDRDVSGCEDASPFTDPIVIAIEDHLDLHPFQPKDIASVVEEYLAQCKQAGFHEVRLIHGKGKGVQRNIIRALLAKHAGVESFNDAALEAGSWGATVVIFKSSVA